MSTSIFPATVRWQGHSVRLLDQTRLPGEEAYLEAENVDALCDAIKRLVVRGAPAIGCSAGFGVVLAFREAVGRQVGDWWAEFEKGCEKLAASRPTAVNLVWAVKRCMQIAQANRALESQAVEALLVAEAEAILREDRQMCEAIGRNGVTLFSKDQITLMTHCNAGALATGGSGTALAVMYAAQEAGIKVKVFADETRPLLQGARLTAWELARAGIEVTVICDSMAAMVMRRFKPDAVITGADRIAANGDAANKIGTYGLAILAKHHGIPFYVAAPSSTFDLSLETGASIPIEERDRSEIAEPFGTLTVPADAQTFNPAFDVTPADLIDAVVTEKGVLRPPYGDSIAEALAGTTATGIQS